jgi:hypothetical protein
MGHKTTTANIHFLKFEMYVNMYICICKISISHAYIYVVNNEQFPMQHFVLESEFYSSHIFK